CGSGGTTTTLAVTVETDATLVSMLDEIALAADASGRPEATTHFTVLSESLRWTIRVPNVPGPFDALVSATGRSGGRDVVATAARATLTPGQESSVVLKLTANCAAPQAPACRADQICA